METNNAELRALLLRHAIVGGLDLDAALAKAQSLVAWVETGSALKMLPAPCGANSPEGGTAKARNDKPGQSWPFLDHRTVAEVDARAKKKRTSIDVEKFKALHVAGKSYSAIARALNITPAGVNYWAGKLGLRVSRNERAPEPAPVAEPALTKDRAATTALNLEGLITFLRDRGARVVMVGAGKFKVDEAAPTDRIGLLDAANVLRRRDKQPPFSFATV